MADPRMQERAKPSSTEDPVLKTWRFIGGAQIDERDAITAKVATWPEERRLCFTLYEVLYNGGTVAPGIKPKLWIDFGFCAFRDADDNERIHDFYRSLIHCCTFDQFVAAFKRGALTRLATSKGISMLASDDFAVFISGPHGMLPSMWHLKERVLCANPFNFGDWKPHPAVKCDYGWMNVKGKEEDEALVNLYRAYFSNPKAEMDALHEACVEGKLFEYLDQVVDIEEGGKEKYRRLLRNSYPSPEFW